MKKMMLSIPAAALLLSAAAPAFATVECTSAPQDKWMKPEAVQKMLAEQGYDVRLVKVEDSCLEAKATKDGKKLEIYVDPVSGKIVTIKEK